MGRNALGDPLQNLGGDKGSMTHAFCGMAPISRFWALYQTGILAKLAPSADEVLGVQNA